jgi:carboxyl-terminal processing protease
MEVARLLRPASTAGFVMAAFAAGLLLGSQTVAATSDPYRGLDRFARVLGLIEAHYVDPVSTDDLLDASLDGLVKSLDPHTRWLDADAYRALLEENEGRYQGIGIEVREDPRGATIVRVMPEGPAARDGLRVGDLIVGVDGEPVGGLTLSELTKRIRGERGTPIVLTVERVGSADPIAVPTIRDRIDLRPVEWGTLEPDVGYIRISTFQDGAAREAERAINALTRGGASRIVLDLRDNPGGLLDEAVKVADLFLASGPIVTTRGRTDGEHTHLATPRGFPKLPLAVLVDGGSASASEVVAGALQDTGRAPLVGERTFGKGTVQTLMPMRSGGALKLTIARYYTPSGLPVTTEHGRLPDREVALGDDAELRWDLPISNLAVFDPRFPAAIELVRAR